MKKTLSIILALVMLLSLCACSQGEPAPAESTAPSAPSSNEPADEGFTMGVVVKVDVPWFDRLNMGLQQYAEEHNCTIDLYAPASPDASQQVAYIEDLIAKQVDVIGVVPVSSEALESVLQRAREQGIVVVSHEAPNLVSTDAVLRDGVRIIWILLIALLNPYLYRKYLVDKDICIIDPSSNSYRIQKIRQMPVTRSYLLWVAVCRSDVSPYQAASILPAYDTECDMQVIA